MEVPLPVPPPPYSLAAEGSPPKIKKIKLRVLAHTIQLALQPEREWWSGRSRFFSGNARGEKVRTVCSKLCRCELYSLCRLSGDSKNIAVIIFGDVYLGIVIQILTDIQKRIIQIIEKLF